MVLKIIFTTLLEEVILCLIVIIGIAEGAEDVEGCAILTANLLETGQGGADAVWRKEPVVEDCSGIN
jgi:hypothetical protein